jgi:hypothetical protein
MAAIHSIGCCGAAKVTLGVASIAVCGKRQGLRTHYDLGYFDHETCRLESGDNPFQAKVLFMSPV